MNTPRTRKPIRYTKPKPRRLPKGEYDLGIQWPAFAAVYGSIISVWPQIEEAMVGLFSELTGIPDEKSARLVFRSIINQQARIGIMRAMLEKSPLHADKTAVFDELIDDFSRLNKRRNGFAHGLWWTLGGNRCFVEEETSDYEPRARRREVKLGELGTLATEIAALVKRLMDRQQTRLLAEALASYRKPAQPKTQPS